MGRASVEIRAGFEGGRWIGRVVVVVGDSSGRLGVASSWSASCRFHGFFLKNEPHKTMRVLCINIAREKYKSIVLKDHR